MKTLWDLPGGLFIWLISLHESLLFFIGLVVFKYHKSIEPLLFKQESAHLSLWSGITYTLILLFSGWAIAEAQANYEKQAQKAGQSYHFLGLALGFLFLVMKVFDFTDKINKGKSFGESSYWALYWFLNGFHFVHVLIGVILLFSLLLSLRRKASDLETFKSVSIFWHACDLIWILLFSSMYMGSRYES